MIPIIMFAISYFLIGGWLTNFSANYFNAKFAVEGKTKKTSHTVPLTFETRGSKYDWIRTEQDWEEYLQTYNYPFVEPPSKIEYTYHPIKWDDQGSGVFAIVLSMPLLWPLYGLYFGVLKWPLAYLVSGVQKVGNFYIKSGEYMAKELANPKNNVKEIES